MSEMVLIPTGDLCFKKLADACLAADWRVQDNNLVRMPVGLDFLPFPSENDMLGIYAEGVSALINDKELVELAHGGLKFQRGETEVLLAVDEAIFTHYAERSVEWSAEENKAFAEIGEEKIDFSGSALLNNAQQAMAQAGFASIELLIMKLRVSRYRAESVLETLRSMGVIDWDNNIKWRDFYWCNHCNAYVPVAKNLGPDKAFRLEYHSYADSQMIKPEKRKGLCGFQGAVFLTEKS